MKKRPQKTTASKAGKTVARKQTAGRPAKAAQKKISHKHIFSEKGFRALVENNDGIIAVIDKDLHTIFRSASAARLTGWKHAEYERKAAPVFLHPDDTPLLEQAVQQSMKKAGKPVPLSLRVRHKKGHYLSMEGVLTNMLAKSDIQGIIVNLHNVTAKKEAESRLEKTTRLYFFISQINQMIVRTADQQSLFKKACSIAVNIGRFRMAWIGLIDEKTKKLLPVEYAGEETGYLSKIRPISVRNQPAGRGPTGKAIREGRHIVCNDIENDPQMAPWKEAATHRGYLSSMAVPIKKFGKVVGAFSIYASEKNYFDETEIALLEEATGDIGFALENFEKDQQRKIAEAAVAASEKRYHTLTEISPVGIFHTDATGFTTYVNPYWTFISGIQADKALGNGWFDAVHPDDREALLKSWEKATGKQVISVSEYRFLRPDGSIAWVMGQANPERDGNGNVIGYVGTTTEITERKLAEEAIRNSAGKYRTLVEQASDAILLSDDKGNFFEVNDRACDFLGYSHEELYQLNFSDLVVIDEEFVPLRFDELRAGKSIIQKRKLKRKDGEPVVVEISAKQLPDGNMLSIVRDLTERIQTEKQLQLEKDLSDKVINSLPGIFYLSDPTPRLLRWNKAFETISGYSAKELSKITPIMVFDPDDHLAMRQSIEKTYTEGFADVEARLVTKSGEKIPFFFTGVRIEYQGRPAMLGTGIDITERIKAEAAIKQSEEKYRTLIEQASDAVFISDQTGRFITVNRSACELSQFSERELLQMNIYDFAVLEDIRKNPYHFAELQEGKSVTTERVIKRRDGKVIHVEVSAKMLSDTRLLVFVRNITERIKAQNAVFREKNLSDSIINSLPGIFYLFNHEGKYLRWNRNFEKVSKYTAEEIRHMHPLDFFDTEQKELITGKIQNVFSSGEDYVQANFVIKTGEKIPYYFTGTPIEYEGTLCLMGVGIDFSERVKAQEEIRLTSEKLRQLTAYLQRIREEERSRIGREIHDELGQQITAMKMDVAWIDKKLPEEFTTVKTKLRNVISLLDGSNQSIRRILSELRPAILDNQGLVDSIKWLVNRFSENTGVEVALSCLGSDAKLPEPVATCIFRVCQEALTNVTRYAAATLVTIGLTIDSNNINFVVKDNGKGVDTSLAESKLTFGVLGMKERVLSLGGRFEWKSAPGMGTSITIKIPCAG